MIDMLFRLLAVTALLSSIALATQHKGPQARGPFAIIGGEEPPGRRSGAVLPAPWSLGPGDSIGFTFYDFGTGGSAPRNLINYGDGTLSLGRMAAVDSGDFGWLTRGSYFKYFDGTNWLHEWERVESVRRGWTNIAQFADLGGTEVIMSHIYEVNVDSAKGADRWTSTIIWCTMNTWPRLAIGPGLTIHAIATAGPSDIGYHVSSDAGATWSCDRFLFTHPTHVGSDTYDITAKGSKVAIVNAGTGADVVLLESLDGGVTWTETVIWDVDETGGTAEEVPDGSVSILYDANDILHIAWGSYYTDGNGYIYYSVDAGIRHWTSVTGVQEVAYPDPDTTIVPPVARDGNLATQPDLSADPNGNVYIIFSRFINEVDVNGYYYEHVFGIMSSDGGATWTDPSDLTPGTGYDASFPSVADLADADGSLHIVYNCDPFAGNSVQTPGHPDIAVAVMYLRTMVTDVWEGGGTVPSAYRLEQNYPNPFNPTTNVRYSIPTSSFVSLKVLDVLGREVATLVNEEQEAGNYVAEFDAVRLSTGVYFYFLKARDFTETKKMIVLR
jgi:hypothetical protein